VFLQLTSLTQTPRLTQRLESPFDMHQAVIAKLEREAQHARAGRPARVVLKMNALVERECIEALYRASQAGVRIDLIVRGMCALRPGVPGVSDTITVRSIVGRFLEHSRVWYFENAGEPELYLSSADFMERNFFRRVEIAVPVREPSHRARILSHLEIALADNVQTWQLDSDGSYRRLVPGDDEPLSSQAVLLARYAAGAAAAS